MPLFSNMNYEILSIETTKKIASLEIENLKQKKEIERLNNIISKAIEYIENLEEDYIACERSGFYEYQDKTRCLDYEDVEQKLHNILRGEDKE